MLDHIICRGALVHRKRVGAIRVQAEWVLLLGHDASDLQARYISRTAPRAPTDLRDPTRFARMNRARKVRRTCLGWAETPPGQAKAAEDRSGLGPLLQWADLALFRKEYLEFARSASFYTHVLPQQNGEEI